MLIAALLIGSQNRYSKAKLSWISDKRDDTTPTDQRCLQRGSTTVTTLDLIHRQEITHSVGGAAIRSLDFLMCPQLIGRIQTISLLQFLHLKVSCCLFFSAHFCQDTSDRERTAGRLLHWPTLNNETDSGLEPGLDLDQTRSDQNYTAGQDWVLFEKGGE